MFGDPATVASAYGLRAMGRASVWPAAACRPKVCSMATPSALCSAQLLALQTAGFNNRHLLGPADQLDRRTDVGPLRVGILSSLDGPDRAESFSS